VTALIKLSAVFYGKMARLSGKAQSIFKVMGVRVTGGMASVSPASNHRMQDGPPGAIGEKFTVSQNGLEDVSNDQRPLYTEKQRLVQDGISCTYGCTAVLRRTIGTFDRDSRSL
jgi:hypothetical protein